MPLWQDQDVSSIQRRSSMATSSLRSKIRIKGVLIPNKGYHNSGLEPLVCQGYIPSSISLRNAA
jgi:hypothetical protein